MLREDTFTKLHLPWKSSVAVGARASACACERVALLIQYATRMRNVVCGLRLHQIFPTLSHKWHDFQKNVTEYKIYVWIFSTTFI